MLATFLFKFVFPVLTLRVFIVWLFIDCNLWCCTDAEVRIRPFWACDSRFVEINIILSYLLSYTLSQLNSYVAVRTHLWISWVAWGRPLKNNRLIKLFLSSIRRPVSPWILIKYLLGIFPLKNILSLVIFIGKTKKQMRNLLPWTLKNTFLSPTLLDFHEFLDIMFLISSFSL